MTGKPVPEPEPFPPFAAHVLDWWTALHRQRGASFGPAPLSYADIAAYLALTGESIRTHELDWLLAVETAWRQAQSEAQESARGNSR